MSTASTSFIKIILFISCNFFTIRGSFIEVAAPTSEQHTRVSEETAQPLFPFSDGKPSRFSSQYVITGHNQHHFPNQRRDYNLFEHRYNRRYNHSNSKFMNGGAGPSPVEEEDVFIVSSAHTDHGNSQSPTSSPMTTSPSLTSSEIVSPTSSHDFPAIISSSGSSGSEEFEIRLKSALSVSLPASAVASKKSSSRLDIISSTQLHHDNESSHSMSSSLGEPELITDSSSSLFPFPTHVPFFPSKGDDNINSTKTPLPQVTSPTSSSSTTKTSVLSAVPYPPLPNLPSVQKHHRVNNSDPSFTSSQYYFPPLRVTEKKGKGHHPGGLITAIALILANSFAQGAGNPIMMSNDTAQRHPFNGFSTNGTKADHDMMASDSNIITSSATNMASWLRNMISGSKAWMRKQRQPEFNNRNTHSSNSYRLVPQFSHNHGSQASPLPHPGVGPNGQPLNIIPAPEGFPGPYNGESVLLPPEALQDTGIMYWLNFIEQAAQQSQQDQAGGSSDGLHHYHPVHVPDGDQRPLRIGEKPAKTGPNSIRDELIMDEGESPDDGDPFERSRKVVPLGGKGTEESASEQQSDATAPRCDKFTASICVDDFEYPEQAIVDEIYKRREIFELMYSDDAPKPGEQTSLVDGIPRDVEESYVYETQDDDQRDSNEAASSMTTLKDGIHGTSASGYVCPSEVLYGRPKLAKSVSGEWKVIVNAGEFTQTLRMEKCLKPNARCNFIMPPLETRCAQVHSVHRLMVFEKGRGFFVESFKIPTGCNCQILRAGQGNGIMNGLSHGIHDSSSSSSTHTASSPSSFEELLLNPQQSQQSQQNQLFTHNSINSLLNSNRNRYKNQQQSQLSQQALINSLQNLQRNQQQMLHQLTSNPPPPQLTPEQLAMGIYQRQNTVVNNQHQQPPQGINRGQLSNALWSLLMGSNGQGDQQTGQQSLPSDDSISGQLNLLQFLQKQNNPQVPVTQPNTETLLAQLMNDQSRRRVNTQSKVRVKINPTSGSETSINNLQSRPQQLLPGTTTIVNPLGGNNGMAGVGQPLVQVIHVPVSAPGSYSHPVSLFKSPPGHPPLLTAYDSHSSATIFVNNSTSNASNDMAIDHRISHEQESNGNRFNNSNNTATIEYLSTSKDVMYTKESSPQDSLPKVNRVRNPGNNSITDRTPSTPDEEDEDSDDEETTEEDPPEVNGDEKSKHQTVKDEHSEINPSKRRKTSVTDVKTERGSIKNQEGSNSYRDNSNNNSVTKRMLSQKMNFNYHPILEYIPISSQQQPTPREEMSSSSHSQSSLASESAVTVTRNE